MTREEAKELLLHILMTYEPKDQYGDYDDPEPYEQALTMAIEALQDRPQGEWIDYTDDGYVECPFCHNATNCDDNKEELHFCFSCGAYMRGDDE